MAALRESLREAVPWCWQEVRAVEMVLEEVAAEFDGEDPSCPRCAKFSTRPART